MNYKPMMKRLMRALNATEDAAWSVLQKHSVKMESWMIYRLDRIRKQCAEASDAFERYCPEVCK